MSIIQIVDNEYETSIPIGASVVFDNKKIRAYEESKDLSTDIIGVTYSKDALFGREVTNGLVFFENDAFEIDDFFNYKRDEYGEVIPNTKDPKVDPWYSTTCVIIATHGMVPVLKGEPTHPGWILYDSEFSTITDIWWIR